MSKSLWDEFIAFDAHLGALPDGRITEHMSTTSRANVDASLKDLAGRIMEAINGVEPIDGAQVAAWLHELLCLVAIVNVGIAE